MASPKILIVAVLAMVAIPLHSTSAFDDSFPVAQARSSGLAVHWQSQIQADASRDQIVDLCFHIHDDRATTYFEILHSGVRETINYEDLSPRGVPYGEVDAKAFAELRKEMLELEGQTDVTVELITRPQTSIYAVSGYGDVHAIDAESGGTRWKTSVGTPLHPTVGIAANNKYVIVVKGPRVFCLDSNDGHELWNQLTRYAPGGGVAISDHFAYVTSISGALEMFPFTDGGVPEKYFASSGAATEDPVVSATTVSWTTRRGYFNVASSDEEGRLLYRLQTQDEFTAAVAPAGDFLIAPSVNGKVYAIDEANVKVAWELAVGEPVDQSTISIGDNRVALISGLNNLMIIDAKRGELDSNWPRSVAGIREYVGSSRDVLYFLNTTDQLVGLRRDNGSQVLSTGVGENTRVLKNNLTDRMYLTNSSGQLVCLREVANINPFIHSDEPKAQEGPANPFATDPGDTNASPFEQGDKKTEAPAADPNDPFSSGAEKMSDPNDPSSEDKPDAGDKSPPDDPFGDDGDKGSGDGGSGGDNPDDPFGGG